MHKKVLMLDEVYFVKPWKEGIEVRLVCDVTLTESLDKGDGAVQSGIDLVIIEPYLYHAGSQNKSALQLLIKAKLNSIPIYAVSTQSAETLKEYGFILGKNIDYFFI